MKNAKPSKWNQIALALHAASRSWRTVYSIKFIWMLKQTVSDKDCLRGWTQFLCPPPLVLNGTVFLTDQQRVEGKTSHHWNPFSAELIVSEWVCGTEEEINKIPQRELTVVFRRSSNKKLRLDSKWHSELSWWKLSGFVMWENYKKRKNHAGF